MTPEQFKQSDMQARAHCQEVCGKARQKGYLLKREDRHEGIAAVRFVWRRPNGSIVEGPWQCTAKEALYAACK